MTILIGIDIGTTNVKTLLLDADSGSTLATAVREYPINQPQPGYAEQNPDDWWHAVIETVHETLTTSRTDPQRVRAIGLSGQMHGITFLGSDSKPLRSSIIWADTRSSTQCDVLKSRYPIEEMAKHAPGLPAAGFMGPTLMWLAENEPETLRQTTAVLLPKDYIRVRMTGSVGSDASDAAATWLLDVATGKWSDWLLAACAQDGHFMPMLSPSGEVIGTLTAEAGSVLGLPAGIPVIAGCADQPAQALGYGLIDPGTALVTVGTGGQAFHAVAEPRVDPQLRYYLFNHAVPGRWYAAAAILCAGLSFRWLRDNLGLRDHPDAYGYMSSLAAQIPAGSDGLVFLPYLTGERTPHFDPQASGAFIGLRLHHTPGHLARAVMEGVAYALADCLDLVAEPGVQVILSGGAAASPVWKQIFADVFNSPLLLASGANHACIGGALLAGTGAGIYPDIATACSRLPRAVEGAQPDTQAAAFYIERRPVYQRLYSHLCEDMHALAPKHK